MNLRISKLGAVALVLAAWFAVALYLLLGARFGGPVPQLSEPYTVSAEIADTKGLVSRSEVLVRGVPVGTVESVGLDGADAVVVLKVDDEHAPLTDAATVRIGQKTLFGEAYVDLDPGAQGGGAELESGARIAPDNVLAASADVDEALEAFDEPARTDLQRLLAELGGGFGAPESAEQMNQSFAQLERVAAELDQLTAEIEGQEEQMAAGVGYAGEVVETLAANEGSIRQIVSGGRTTIAALGARGESLRAGLEQLPGTLVAARDTLRDARPLLTELDPLSRDLAAATPDLELTLEQLPAVAADANALLAELPGLERVAVPFLRHADEVLKLADGAAPPLANALRNVEPIAAFLSDRKEAFASWFSNTGDLGSHRDAKGYFARFFVGFEPLTGSGQKTNLPTNAYTGPKDALDNQPYSGYPHLEPYDPGPVPDASQDPAP